LRLSTLIEEHDCDNQGRNQIFISLVGCNFSVLSLHFLPFL